MGTDAPTSGPGSNTGHGLVWERPDGMRARCGGPGMCKPCAADAARYGRPTPAPVADAPTDRDPVTVMRFMASEARLEGNLTTGETAMCVLFELAADLLADTSRVGVGEDRRLVDAVAAFALAMYDEMGGDDA